MYRIRALDAGKYSGETTMQGSVLMGAGVELKLEGDYDSTALALEKAAIGEFPEMKRSGYLRNLTLI